MSQEEQSCVLLDGPAARLQRVVTPCNEQKKNCHLVCWTNGGQIFGKDDLFSLRPKIPVSDTGFRKDDLVLNLS